MGSFLRLALLAVLVLVVFVVGAPVLLGQVPALRSKLPRFASEEEGGKQSAAQLSRAEFVEVAKGMTRAKLRALVGEPESTSSNKVENLEVECWYYGVVGTSGTYQFCFVDGRLRSKVAYRKR